MAIEDESPMGKKWEYSNGKVTNIYVAVTILRIFEYFDKKI